MKLRELLGVESTIHSSPAATAVVASPPVTVTMMQLVGYPIENWVSVCTICYIAIITYVLIRDKILRDPNRRDREVDRDDPKDPPNIVP